MGANMARSEALKLTVGEEVANTITHGVPVLILLALFPLASIVAYERGSIIDVIGVSIFCISIILMFLMSTIYHLMDFNTKHKDVMKILDHIFIYVAIAGSYTPIAISVIGGWQAAVILSFQWAMVLFGILYKSLSKKSIPKVSLLIYLVMGWTIVLFFPRFLDSASVELIGLMFAGGVFYTVGAYIYYKRAFKYFHMVWHLFVLFGVACHYVGIVFFLY